MKHLKLLGLVTVTAAALMAFVGAGTASATVICKTEPTAGVCPEGWDYPAGSKGKASLAAGTSVLLRTTAGSIEATCAESTVEGTSENTGSATTTVHSILTAITFSNCSRTVDTIRPGTGELHWISGTNNGTLTTTGVEVTIVLAGVTCTFGLEGTKDVGTTVGGNPGSLTVNVSVVKKAGSFLCPSTAVFEAKYVATEPTNAWVAER
jgi:hypothetical protein